MASSSSSTTISTAIYNTRLFETLLAKSKATPISHLTIRQTKYLGYGRDIQEDQVPAGYPKSTALPQLQPPQMYAEGKETPEHRAKRLEVYREAEGKLIKAIAAGKLANLTDFTWNTDPPLFDLVCGSAYTVKGEALDLWTALGKYCPKLVNLTVLDAAEYNYQHNVSSVDERIMEHAPPALKKERPFAHTIPIHDSSMFTAISGLHSFVYQCYSYRHSNCDVPMDKLCGMLRRCPDLEKIEIKLELSGARMAPNDSAPFDALLEDPPMVFKRLHTIIFLGIRASAESAVAFFNSHPSLVYVNIWHQDGRDVEDSDTFGQCEATLLSSDLPNIVEFIVDGTSFSDAAEPEQ